MSPKPVPRFSIDDDIKPEHARPSRPVDTRDLAAAPFDPAARRRLRAWLEAELNADTLMRRENWPLGLSALVAGGIVVLVVWLVIAFVTALVKAAGSGGSAAADWLGSDAIIRTVTGPITGWLDTHAAGLPATGGDLSAAWLGIAVLLYVAAIGGSTYGRIAWALTGIAAIAAAYAGATITSAAVAAGTTAALWLLLSLPVYRRRRRRDVPANNR